MLCSLNYTTCWFCFEARGLSVSLYLSITGWTEWEKLTWVRQLPWARPVLWRRGQLGWDEQTTESRGEIHPLVEGVEEETTCITYYTTFPLLTFNTANNSPDKHNLLRAILCESQKTMLYIFILLCFCLWFNNNMSKNNSSNRSFHSENVQCVPSTVLNPSASSSNPESWNQSKQ